MRNKKYTIRTFSETINQHCEYYHTADVSFALRRCVQDCILQQALFTKNKRRMTPTQTLESVMKHKKSAHTDTRKSVRLPEQAVDFLQTYYDAKSITDTFLCCIHDVLNHVAYNLPLKGTDKLVYMVGQKNAGMQDFLNENFNDIRSNYRVDGYAEPFCGTANVLLHSNKSDAEFLNDNSVDLVNLLRTIQRYPDELRLNLLLTPLSIDTFNTYKKILKQPFALTVKKSEQIARATAFYFCRYASVFGKGESFKSKTSEDGYHRRLDSIYPLSQMSLREMAQCINSMLERERILAQHKSPISQNKNDKRWRTRLPNGKQLAKTRLEDLEDAVIEYYANLPKDNNSIIPQDDYTDLKGIRHAVKSTAKVMGTRTLKTLYPEWMEVRQYEASDNSAAINERMWQNYIENSDIADIPLAELTRNTIKAWACELITTHSMKKKYFDGIRDVINLLLDYAVDEKYIDSNCFKGTRINKNLFQSATLKEENEEVFTMQEQKLVMQEAELDSKKTRSALPLGICILFLISVRIGELCGLQYGDISDKYVYIRRMVVEKKKKTPSGWKSDGYKIVEHTKSSAGLRISTS